MRKHGKDRLAGGARLFRCSAAQSRKLDRNTCGTAVMLRSLVIAGEQEGRVVNAIEIEPAYVDVTVRAVGRLHRPEGDQNQRSVT